MTKEVDDILSVLYSDKITIEEACKSLNKTRKEMWDLLDAFEYIPTSEDVSRACEIEQESMRIIENRAKWAEKISDNKSSDMSLMAVTIKTLFEAFKLKTFSRPS